MSHPVNDEIKENLYEEAIEEVADAFPSLPSGLAGDIAMMIAKDRWHNIDEEQSGYSPINKHKALKAFKDGVSDACLSGTRDDEQSHYYYKLGYDFGITLYCNMTMESDDE